MFNMNELMNEFNGIPYPRHQAHRSNHLEKIYFKHFVKRW